VDERASGTVAPILGPKPIIGRAAEDARRDGVTDETQGCSGEPSLAVLVINGCATASAATHPGECRAARWYGMDVTKEDPR